MIRKRGKESTKQDSASASTITQSQGTSKGSQAAAKVERFAHTLGQTPPKGGQQNPQAHSKPQSRASTARRIQGHSQVAAAMEVNNPGGKSVGEEVKDTPKLPQRAGGP